MNVIPVRKLPFLALLSVALFALSGCGGAGHDEGDGHGHGHGHGAEAGEHGEEGPHGGRVLEEGEFALEVSIFEDNTPPEFRLYPTWHGEAVPAGEVTARIELTRVNGLPDGKVEQHTFTASENYLVSAAEVYEPHSFRVKLDATYRGQTYSWSYESFEGLVEIPSGSGSAQSLATAEAGPGVIAETLPLYGRIQPNAERVRAVVARFPGIVESVAVQVGDSVRAGQTLAVVESNESLRTYTVTAPIAGTVVRRNTNPGEASGSEPLFEVANFSSVWAEFAVFPRDRGRLRPGQAVEVVAADGESRGTGRTRYISPVGTASQSLIARVELDNASGQWTPGQFVNARVTVADSEVPILVPLTALQTFRDWDVVAVTDGEHYQLQPVELGRRDGRAVEILSGLERGARVVVTNSYLIKADVEKSGASHEH